MYLENSQKSFYSYFIGVLRMEIQENPDITFKQLITQFIRDDTKTRLIELLMERRRISFRSASSRNII